MAPVKRKRIIIGAFIAILILTASAFGYLNYINNNNNLIPTPTPTISATPGPTPIGDTAPSQLDGTLVATKLATRRPLAVVVENHPDSRPQVGLTSASIVYETLAEGGITRFMAIFGPRLPAKIGPVRSARTYFVSWAKEYDAMFAHVGGSGDALGRIMALKVKDLSQFRIGTYAFWREPRGGIATEHTMFTDPKKLYKYAYDIKHWPKTCTFPLWTFKDDAALAARPASSSITVNFSYGTMYQARWKYDQTTNLYKRSMAGSTHRDRISGEQITAKNVLIQYNQYVYKAGKKDHNLVLIGSGKILLFRDGIKIKGTWKKATKYSRTLFYDSAGQPPVFNRGTTWIEAASPGHSQVSYKVTPVIAPTTPTPSVTPTTP